MPSVITTASGMPASIASIDGGLGERRRHEDDRHVRAGGLDGLATVPNTGTETPPSKSTVVPALRGLTPPTMEVPLLSIRWVCFMPSEPASSHINSPPPSKRLLRRGGEVAR